MKFLEYVRIINEEHEGVRKHLDSLPVRKQNWLDPHHVKDYGNKHDEVDTHHVAKMSSRENTPHAFQKHQNKSPEYKKTEIHKIPLDKVHYTQPGVNKGKLAHLAHHYHPDHKDFHQTDGTLGKHNDAPGVHKYPDGTYVSNDHHRLIAAHLRGDTHAHARVTTWDHDGKGGLKQVKTKKEKL